MKFFRFGKVNPRVLAHVGGQGRRSAFLGTANQKAQPFAHDLALAERTVMLFLSSD